MVHSKWYNIREGILDTSTNTHVNNTDTAINNFQISKLLYSSLLKFQAASKTLFSCLNNSTVNIDTSVIVKPLICSSSILSQPNSHVTVNEEYIINQPSGISPHASLSFNNTSNVNTSNVCYDKLNILYNNIDNSLCSKLDEIETFISTNDTDILMLSEIKPKKRVELLLDTVNIKSYTLFTSDISCSDTRGVGIYIKNCLKPVEYIIPETSSYTDSVWVQLHMKDSFILLGCIYRSGTPATALKYDCALHKLLRHVSMLQHFSHIIIAGDFNHKDVLWKDGGIAEMLNVADEDFINCVLDCYFYQHIDFPTRKRSYQKENVLDLVFTNSNDTIANISSTAGMGLSDHVSLLFQVEVTRPVTKHNLLPVYSKGNYDNIRSDLSIDWENHLLHLNAEEAMSFIEEHIHKAVGLHVPMRKNISRNKPLWMDTFAFRKVKQKHSKYVRYLNTKADNSYKDFVKARNEAAKAIRYAKKHYECRLAKEAKTNQKAIWKYINSKSRSTKSICSLRTPDGTLTETDKDTAETLANQYSSVFTKENLHSFPELDLKPVETKMSPIQITKNDVYHQLNILRIDKSAGPDNLHPRVLHETAHVIDTALSILFNKCLTEGVTPRSWKTATVSPIFKNGSKQDPSNYRPVSVTSVVSKIMERLISQHIQRHIKKNNLLSNVQHGFMSNKSTTTNLLEATNFWTEHLQHHIPVDVVYLDFSKAFDRVAHQRLLRTLSSYQLDKETVIWIKSFLSNRLQQVRVNNSFSSLHKVTSGVPQGSVLGPLLFNIFINDSASLVKSNILLFADDTKLYSTVAPDGSSHIQDDLDSLQEWSEDVQLLYNPSKCKVMHMGVNNPSTDYTMTSQDGTVHVLESINEQKDLGVMIDNKLSYKSHILSKVSKANQMTSIIRKSFTNLDHIIFPQLFKALIRPHVEYASCIWSPSVKYLSKKIEGVQRRASKLPAKLKDLPYEDRLHKLKLPSLKYRRRRIDLLQCYKILHNIDIIENEINCLECGKSQMLELQNYNKTRGHQMKLTIQRSYLKRHSFFSSRVATDWNGLPENVVLETSVNKFKSALSKVNNEKNLFYVFDQ